MSDFIPMGSLEQMGISVETNLPEGVLTPAYAKGVKFTQTKPGYHFREVEAYKESVDHSLEAYAALLHQRDLDVHRLGGELDRSQVDIKNLQNQIEVFEFKGGVAQANADDSEISTLLATNEQLRAKNQQLEAEKQAADNQIAELNKWADDVTQYVASLEARLASTPVAAASASEPSPVEPAVQPAYVTEPEVAVPAYTPEPEPVVPVYTPEPTPEPVVPVYVPEPQPVAPQPQVAPQQPVAPAPGMFPGITEDDLR